MNIFFSLGHETVSVLTERSHALMRRCFLAEDGAGRVFGDTGLAAEVNHCNPDHPVLRLHQSALRHQPGSLILFWLILFDSLRCTPKKRRTEFYLAKTSSRGSRKSRPHLPAHS